MLENLWTELVAHIYILSERLRSAIRIPIFNNLAPLSMQKLCRVKLRLSSAEVLDDEHAYGKSTSSTVNVEQTTNKLEQAQLGLLSETSEQSPNERGDVHVRPTRRLRCLM